MVFSGAKIRHFTDMSKLLDEKRKPSENFPGWLTIIESETLSIYSPASATSFEKNMPTPSTRPL